MEKVMKNNLPVYIWTANQQMCCLPAWAYLFNKFWPTDTNVTVLGYDIPDFELPKNFKYISLGKQRGPKFWSDDMIDYFSTCTDEYFYLTTEDGFIVKPVNARVLDYLTEIMMTNLESNLLRICLTKDVSHRPHNVLDDLGDFQLISAGDNTQYRNSLQHSIWNRKNFLKELPLQCNPWEFEINTGKHNDMNILATKSIYALHVGHGYKKGHKIKEWYVDCNDRSHRLDESEVQKIENNNWVPEI
jgi:hypothetical protein